MQTDCVYVVMYEYFDDYGCHGRDMYMSLDYDRAVIYLDSLKLSDEDFKWQNDMWFRSLGKYGWEKYYIDIRTLDEEL